MCNKIWLKRFCESPNNRCTIKQICPAQHSVNGTKDWKCPIVAYLEFIGEYDD